MLTESASFRDFRNLEDTALTFSPAVNVLWGKNAQGKSNILEGIYYFARGRSFRGAKEKNMIRTGTEQAEILLSCRSEKDTALTPLSVTFPRAGRRKITRNGAEITPREMLGSFRAVLFCPAHLTLVTGSPDDRRTFLDIAIAQLSPRYVIEMARYNTALKERNALIHQTVEGHPQPALWELYAEEMARTGAYITAVRLAYMNLLEKEALDCFTEMTEGAEKPSFRYISAGCGKELTEEAEETLFPDRIPEGFVTNLRESLLNNLPREWSAVTTLYGIHRDDVEIRLNGTSAKLYASQGQTRSIALAMKLGEGAISRSVTGEQPVYLLDDVFSELDENRRAYLLSSIRDRQVILTSCDPDIIEKSLTAGKLLQVCAGKIV